MVESRPRLETVRQQRGDLRRALGALEHALAGPAGADGWRPGVSRAVAELRAALVRHVETTEATDGLFAEILEEAPRLGHLVDTLRRDHEDLGRETEALSELVLDAAPEVIRKHAVDLMAHVAQHRHHGADLLYEAYSVDIGAGD